MASRSVRSVFRHNGYRIVLWVVPTVALTIVLFALGERGVDLAEVLSVPLGVCAIGIVLFRRSESASHHAPVDTRTKFVAGALTLLAGALPPAVVWFCYDRYVDLDVRVGPTFQLTEEAPAVILPTLPRSQWGGELTFTPRLAAVSSLGDCVLPARLKILPVVDGRRLPVEEARHGTQTAIAIPDGTRAVELNISLVVPPDQGCVLSVTLAQAVLHRTPW